MVVYNFKTIVKVPASKELIDIILSRTQRKTPTVCHRGWYIQRIRDFYARKVKFTCESFTDKLTQMLNDFPRVDDIHPYYADLINVLYSKHHYKLALGQISQARTLIENIAKDTLKFLKYAETQYRCKCQKRAALGRMATIARKLNTSLGYLERVRQHMSRLPSIDPNTRTVIITGFPNVGKSSFINKVSRADVDVQNYAFTTKSAHVGHFDYHNYRWQIVDTPGILDHSLEDRNIIEMQAITALAHLNATVLFFIDISESCGYTIKKQASLYFMIKELFSNKPLLVVANKTDLRTLESLEAEDRALIDAIAADRNTQIIPMSNATEDGVSKVKATACDMLLRFRCERSLQSAKMKHIANRINIATPTPRDDKQRGVSIPEAVLKRRADEAATRELLIKNMREQGITDEEKLSRTAEEAIVAGREKRVTLQDIVDANGGPRNFIFDYRTYHDLANPDWRFDSVPEFMDGKNVADFYDPDIEACLDALEREEEELQAAFEESGLTANDDDELTEEQAILLAKIRTKKALMAEEGRLRHGRGNARTAVMPRNKLGQSLARAQERLGEIGLDTEKFTALVEERSEGRGRARKRALEDARQRGDESGSDDDDDDEDAVDEHGRSRSVSRAVSRMRNHPSHVRSQSRMHGQTPEKGDGFRDAENKRAAEQRGRQTLRRLRVLSVASEADRHVYDWKPKHLNEGKRGIGKTDRR